MRKTRRFDCQPESVAGARHFVRDVLSDQPRETVEAAELMISELATNSVRHAHSDFEVAIRLSRRDIRVEVSDHGQGQPVPRSPRPWEQSGRGLQIVLQLSDAWGINPSPNGKLVWFTLRLSTPAGEHKSRSTAARGKEPEQSREPEQSHEVALDGRAVRSRPQAPPQAARRRRRSYAHRPTRPTPAPAPESPAPRAPARPRAAAPGA
jgi:anti-sigma regulatory factor (Ser/Thr protein kinase)